MVQVIKIDQYSRTDVVFLWAIKLHINANTKNIIQEQMLLAFVIPISLDVISS